MSLNLIEAEFSESAEEKPDWSLIAEDGVDGIAQRAARKASDEYGLSLEYEDAHQEALILMASRPSKARAALDLGPGALFRWIGQRLRDEHLTEVKRRSTMKSWELNRDQLEAQGH